MGIPLIFAEAKSTQTENRKAREKLVKVKRVSHKFLVGF